MDLWLQMGATSLLVVGLVVSLRHRSPYRRTPADPPIDAQTRRGQLVGRSLFLTGLTCQIVSHFVR